MARQLRIAYPGAYYHVTARGNERKVILPSIDRHPVKRVNTATEVINDKADKDR